MKNKKVLTLSIVFAIAMCLVLGQGCAFRPSKVVLYQVQTPISNFTYSFQSKDENDKPLSFPEFLGILGFGEEAEEPIEEKEL